MTAEPDASRPEEWLLVVRRSFGIADDVGDVEARATLVEFIEEQLQQSGWQAAPRAIADPMVEALIVVGASGGFDEYLFASDERVAVEAAVNTRDAALVLIDKGMTEVDPEHLVFDVTGEYPVEVVVAAQRVLDQVARYVRDQPFNA